MKYKIKWLCAYIEEWEKHYLYQGLLAELCPVNQAANRIAHYNKALSLTSSEAEKKILRKKVKELLLLQETN